MRKKTAILGMFCLLCSLAASAAPVSAAEEIEEIARLEADIREFADSCAGGWTEISVIGTGEVDFSRAYRICVDVDLFEEESLSREDYLMLEAEAPAVWVIPVYYENATCLVEVSRGLPLNESAAGGMTEEEKQEILEKEGQWTPVACSVEAGYVDYPARVEELLTENNLDAAAAEYALAGGVPGIRTPLVVIFENGMASRLISPDCDVTAFLDPAARSSAANGGEEIVLEQGKSYPFSEFRAAALMNRQGAAPDTASGTGENEENAEAFPLAPTVVVIIAAGAAAGWLLAHKRRRGKAA